MKQKTLLLTLTFLTLMLSIFSINAIVLNNPTNGVTVSGNYVLNATNATGSEEFITIKNCTFYAKSASTANSSWTILKSSVNDTLSRVNVTFDSTILEDASDYIFNATCRNNSNDARSTTTTGITVDNTSPTAPSSLSPATSTTLTTASTQSFSVTVVDRETTTCTCRLSVNGNARTCTATYSAASCTFTYPFTADVNGLYEWAVTASDGTQSTESSVNKLNVNIPGGGSGSPGGGGGVVTTTTAPSIVSQTALPTGEQVKATASNFGTSIVNFFQGIFDFFKNLFTK